MHWRTARVPAALPADFIHPLVPTRSDRAPTGPNWIHEVKHDGYRLIVRRSEKRVRLFIRRGYDWTHKFPWVVEALNQLRVRSATIDGEAVYCEADGISNIDKLHSQRVNGGVFLYAFDLLEVNGEDYREERIEKRKGKLEKLLARTPGLRFVEHLLGNGATIFEHACKLQLEGIVSKRAGFALPLGTLQGVAQN